MNSFKWIFTLVLITSLLLGLGTEREETGSEELLIEVVTSVLDKWHYSSDDIEFNDSFSQKLFDDFLKEIDGNKQWLLKSDVRNLSRYRNQLDDELNQLNIEFFDEVYQLLMERIEMVEGFYEELLEKPFDFSKDESFQLNAENIDYASSISELKNNWRKRTKFYTLNRFIDKKEQEKQNKEQDPSYQMKSDKELEEESRKTTKENLDLLFSNFKELKRKNWFTLYINTLSSQFDPHTNYFAPAEKERFDMGISGKYEGIGARLQKRDQEVKVIEVILGGPVWKDNLLEVGDVILQVSQKDQEPVNISGMILDDAVKLIKGPKGTQVILTVRRVDGTIEKVPVIRDQVELEQTYAKSVVIESDGKRYGLIELPKFYIDFSDSNQRDAAKDVAAEIKQLKKRNIEGIILDLRNNGGGALQTAVEMTGHFIEKGPVVQVKSTGGRKEVLKDTNPSILWNGPLVILVNEFSASASEIVAGALQDYQRAIIIGSSQTFGKGTVQNVVDLNRVLRNRTSSELLGALKLTTDMYYRVNGKSTQLEGVKSDITFIDRYAYLEMGEKDQENPIAWNSINPVDYKPFSSIKNYQYAIEKSNQRLKENSYVKLIEQQAQWIKSQQDNDEVSLNFQKYNEEKTKDREDAKKFERLEQFRSQNSFTWFPEVNSNAMAFEDKEFKERRDNWVKRIKSDIYIDEAVEVLKDLNAPNPLIPIVAQNQNQ